MLKKNAFNGMAIAIALFTLVSCTNEEERLLSAQTRIREGKMKVRLIEAESQDLNNTLMNLKACLEAANSNIKEAEKYHLLRTSAEKDAELKTLKGRRDEIEKNVQALEIRIKASSDSIERAELALVATKAEFKE